MEDHQFSEVVGHTVTQVISTNIPMEDYAALFPNSTFTDFNARVGDAYLDGAIYYKPDGDWEFNPQTLQWEDPRTLDDFKAAKWTEIKRERDAREFGGFEWDGSTFDTDALSQSRISSAALAATLNPPATFDWTLKDNTVRTLTAAEFAQMATDMLAFVALQHAIARDLRTQINNASSEAALNGIHWPT